MNRIVRHHYPVENLPEDLKREFRGAREVTVTVEAADAPAREPSGAGNDRAMSFEDIFRSRRPPFRSAEDIMADIREGRDDER